MKTENDKTQSIDKIILDAREAYYRAILDRLTDAILVAFHIPGDDNQLVPFIGYGDEATNREALTHWIAIALQNPDLPMAHAALPHLVRRFEARYHRILGNEVCYADELLTAVFA